jgi:hypothetical protein
MSLSKPFQISMRTKGFSKSSYRNRIVITTINSISQEISVEMLNKQELIVNIALVGK